MANYEEARTKVTNESGRLVWVRRANGTWWPGQILSIDQVPESSISSRRSGTPVKLLGRQDASVDWFNVETSKRIKAFRCGEFDKCIEKAEACIDNFRRIPVNYARRGDAILDALQLEREMAESPSPSVSVEESDETYSISSEDTNSEEQISPHSNIYAQDTSEDDRTEGVEDLRVGVSSKRKRTLTPHVKEFWKKKGLLSEEPALRKQMPGFSSMHRSDASQKPGVGCQGGLFKAQSFCPEDFINSGPATSGAATAVISGSLETSKIKLENTKKNRKYGFENYVGFSDKLDLYLAGSTPRDVHDEFLSPQRLLPFPDSYLFSGSIYDPSSNLFEVEVEGSREYKPQNVPFVCLKSSLNGWSILGHPLDVGVMDDGFRDHLMKSSGGYVGISDEDEDPPNNHSDQRRHGRRPAPKKLRRVSSLIASDHTLPKIIPELKKLDKPSVQCVPLNLVYSRLNAALDSKVQSKCGYKYKGF